MHDAGVQRAGVNVSQVDRESVNSFFPMTLLKFRPRRRPLAVPSSVNVRTLGVGSQRPWDGSYTD